MNGSRSHKAISTPSLSRNLLTKNTAMLVRKATGASGKVSGTSGVSWGGR